jgi:hypothetical protein
MALSFVSHSSLSHCWQTYRWPPNLIMAANFAQPCMPSPRSKHTITYTMRNHSRSFSRSWRMQMVCKYSRMHRCQAWEPRIWLPTQYPTSKQLWTGTLTQNTMNRHTVRVLTETHPKKHASHGEAVARNLIAPSRTADARERTRTRITSQRRIRAPTARNSIARSPIKSNQTSACGTRNTRDTASNQSVMSSEGH